ncbi:MAG TPA: DUF4430 domain-containing protein [Solirubrobacteraceae bacterium]|nr:DUF4430 domain-containing protein [Solirubrobacteraceae bacterium]
MKKVVLVLSSKVVLLGGVSVPIALGSASSAARPVGPTVKVTVKTLTQTLLGPTAARGRTGWITKGGTPRGKCSAASAAGALNAATHGRWTGKYYSGIGIFIESILGVKPSGKAYWSIYVNGRSSSLGICSLKLRAGEQLLFKIHK